MSRLRSSGGDTIHPDTWKLSGRRPKCQARSTTRLIDPVEAARHSRNPDADPCSSFYNENATKLGDDQHAASPLGKDESSNVYTRSRREYLSAVHLVTKLAQH